jgi:hypothetical protein
MSGGISLPELLNNEAQYAGPLYLSLGSGLVGPLVEGIPGAVILECIRCIWDAVVEHDMATAQSIAKTFAKKNAKYKKCLQLIRADEALRPITKG